MIFTYLKNRWIKAGISIFFISLLFPLPTFAQHTNYVEEGNACGTKILTFFISFLGADNFTDYWADFFVRNRCHQEDIFALQDEIDSLILELYETDCEVAEFTEIENDIRKKKMELYFVRHIVPTSEDASSEEDQKATDYDLIASTLLNTMIARYSYESGKGWISTEDLKILFAEWQKNYEYRIKTYKNCTNSPWQEVGDKFKKLLKTIKDVATLFSPKNIKETWQPYGEDLKKQYEEKGIINASGKFQGMGSVLKSFWKENLEMNIRNLPSKEDLEDIMANFEAEGSLMTTFDAQTALQTSNVDYNLLKDKAELIARYSFLYLQGSGQITTRLTDKIDTLDNLVCESTSGGQGVNLNSLYLTAKDIRKKQK